MKILWLSHLVPYPPKGGVLQRSFYLLRELSRRHDVSLLAFNQRKLMQTVSDDPVRELVIAHEKLTELCKCVEFFDIPYDNDVGKVWQAASSLIRRDPYTINWLKSATYRDVVTECAENRQFDLVHFDTISLAPYAECFSGTPLVLDHHNIESHLLIRRAEVERNRLKRFYYAQEGHRLLTYERSVARKFGLHITCSDLDSERLIETVGDVNCQTVPNGVDISFFDPKPNIEPLSFIFVGRLNWAPNRDAVLFIVRELWPAISQRWPDAIFRLVGANAPREALDYAERCSSFIVEGFVDDVRTYLDRAAIFLCPIRDGGGTKLKLLDAFSMQKAVVANPIACEGISVTSRVNVLTATTPDEYLEQIASLLDEPEAITTMGLAARQLVADNYAYTSIGEKMSSMYIDYVESYRSDSF